ncbi:hypothetical protein GIB67_016015 [Kingdonia uniflora]|uniref:Retrotransposon gag domain-containing protein n=1 Tax=Kingdonia uniflora TaxID=39325 RepID=A0A7J7L1V0_9MAGN|nr:hypothetical protein GIB67_016015 [Kingdonia uniflora]
MNPNVKINVQEFDGKIDADGFIDWLNRVDRVLAFKICGDSCAITLMETKLTGYALNWWEGVQQLRVASGGDYITDWGTMRQKLMACFRSGNYEEESFAKLQNHRQTRIQTLDEYVSDFYLFSSRVLSESEARRISRFIAFVLALSIAADSFFFLFFCFTFDRDDITLIDPLNTFTGIEKYKLIFWALRFHGRILFREISLEVFRVWQPSENVILIRWNLRGVPRVPWEAKGQFQGTSRYKLDRKGKIYEHKIDNLAFNFPRTLRPSASVLDLVTACPASPNPTFMWGPTDTYSSPWLEFYRAVTTTVDAEENLVGQQGFVTCS